MGSGQVKSGQWRERYKAIYFGSEKTFGPGYNFTRYKEKERRAGSSAVYGVRSTPYAVSVRYSVGSLIRMSVRQSKGGQHAFRTSYR